MKDILTKLWIALSIVALAASCNSAELMEQNFGYLSVSLETDSSEDIVFKSTTGASEDQVFALAIYKDDELIREYADHRELQADPLRLPVARYRIAAKCGAETDAAWNSPFYYGETEVMLSAEKTVAADITCTLANVKVTVNFSQDIVDNFSEYTLNVVNVDGKGLTFSNLDGTLGNEAFFAPTSALTWTLRLVNNNGVVYEELTDTYNDVKARQHYNLSFSLAEEPEEIGAGMLTLLLDNSLTVKEYTASVDLSGSSAPTITTNEEFVITDPVDVAFGVSEPRIVYFNAPQTGIRHAIIRHSDASLYSLGLPFSTDLVGAAASETAALNVAGVSASAVSYGAVAASMDITELCSKLPIGAYTLEFLLYDVRNHKASLTVNLEVRVNADVDMVSVDPWAEFAFVEGRWFLEEQPTDVSFEYKTVASDTWTLVESSSVRIDQASQTFSADIYGLEGSTEYVIRAVSADNTDTRQVKFTTDNAEQLYNFSFDDWYQDGKVWYPYAQGANPTVWDSANKGAANLIGSSTTPETSDVVSGKAAKMESKYAVIAFAAGNLYTGQFGAINGVGAELDWGVKFNGRPVALRGYYKYAPKAIDRTKSPYENMAGTMDKCVIQVILAKWDKPFHVNTTAGQFVDIENDPDIIATAKYTSDVTTDGYVEFCLPIEYRNFTDEPTYVIVTACASYLGDYFTGGEGSIMYVDEFSFEYDLSALSEADRAKTNIN